MPYRDDSQRPPFDVEAAAKRIAEARGEHNAFKDHVQDQKEFGPEVVTREDYARLIKETMTAPDTQCFHAGRDRTIFYRESTNTFVAYDPARPHGGTCYRPDGGVTEGRRQFNDAFKGDVDWTNGSPDGSRIVTGGYEALYQGQTLSRQGFLDSDDPDPTKPSGQQRKPEAAPADPSPSPSPQRTDDGSTHAVLEAARNRLRQQHQHTNEPQNAPATDTASPSALEAAKAGLRSGATEPQKAPAAEKGQLLAEDRQLAAALEARRQELRQTAQEQERQRQRDKGRGGRDD